MVQLFTLDLEASRVGLADGRPVALTLLGLRETRAWLAGVGVIPVARGWGYGAAITQAAVDQAAARGAREISLEVLETNTIAQRIYERLGFQHVRRLGVWARPPRTDNALVVLADTEASTDCIAEIDPAAAFVFIAAMRTRAAPWQRDTPTLESGLSYYRGLLASVDGQPAAVLLFSATREFVDVLELVSLGDDDHGRAALALLNSLIAQFPDAPLRMVNYDEKDPLATLFEAAGATAIWWQHEMRLAL